MNSSTSHLVSPDTQARPSKRRVVRRAANRRVIARRPTMPPCPYRMYAQARNVIRRLNHAFNALWHQGILGGHDLWCDDTGCLADMLERADVEVDAGREIIGVCYYGDFASTELDENGTLFLGWCPYEPDLPGGDEVGKKIQEALENWGLMTRWGGCETNKIEIYGLKKPWGKPWEGYWSPSNMKVD